MCAGGILANLQWIDIKVGILDNSYNGLIFAIGTTIILSKVAVKILLEKENQINYSIIDDVSIAIFYKKLGFTPESYEEHYITNSNKMENHQWQCELFFHQIF